MYKALGSIPSTIKKKKKKAKEGDLAEWLKWKYVCLASMRPCVQTPLPPKKKV
jgi:hypothetical protein